MMLDHLGHPEAGRAIEKAIEAVLDPKSGAPRTPDIGGKAKTRPVRLRGAPDGP